MRIGIVGAENSHTVAVARTLNLRKACGRARVVAVWGETRPPAEKAAFTPKELQPQQEGRRGYANDLSAPAVLKGYSASEAAGTAVIDLSTQLTAGREVVVHPARGRTVIAFGANGAVRHGVCTAGRRPPCAGRPDTCGGPDYPAVPEAPSCVSG